MKSNTSGRVLQHFCSSCADLFILPVSVFLFILIVNATRSHADLQKGFSALPGKYFLENLRSVANDGSFPMFSGIINSVDRVRMLCSIMYILFFPDCLWHLCL